MNESPRTIRVWELTQESFEGLLTRLDPDRESAGQKYEVLRLKLVKFFEWRGSKFPEELADETLNRVARKIHSGSERVDDPVRYSFGVARLINLERLKEEQREEAAMKERSLTADTQEGEVEDLRLECFRKCLEKLDPASRELIVNYYGEEKRDKVGYRREIAERLTVSLNTLRIRTHRIRARLERCVLNCLEAASAR